MKNTMTRMLSMLLCLVLCLTMMPAALASEADVPAEAPVAEEILTGDDAPAEEPAEETPAEEPVEETPAEEPVEETPAEEPVEETPAEEPVEETPAEEPVEETPAEEPVEETPDEEPVEETPDEEPVEETPDEEPAEEPAEIGGTITAPLEHATAPESPLSPEELLNGYAQQELDSLKPQGATIQSNLGGNLTGPAKVVYTQAKALAKNVAAGSQTSTVLTIPASTVFGKTTMTEADLGVPITVDGSFNYDIFTILNEMAMTGVVDCLLIDCPYDLYWFDKTYGYNYGVGSLSYNSTSVTLNGDFTLRFAVNADYAPGNKTGGNEISTSYGTLVQKAVNNAKQIVSTASSYTDYNKLVYYRNRICALTEYNTPAAQGSYTYNYGNPWQLIWVFDGDTSTKVVCEGYAKAFQYLCDLSTFSGFITCYSVYGDCGGAHMWNVISMPDGKNYLVDVTNCDGSSVGAPDKLFLVGYKSASGSYSGKTMAYTFAPNSYSLTYTYDTDLYDIFTQKQLTLSSTNYDPNYTPGAIQPVISSIANTATGVKITWGAVSGAAKYAVYRKMDGESKYSRYTVTTATSYTDKNTVNGKFYYYRIWCMDDSGNLAGEWSNARGITCNSQVSPTISSIANTSAGVKITWGAMSGAAKYAVYRKMEGESKYSRYTITTATSYTDKNVVNGSFYYYRIWGMNSSGSLLGAWSNARGITANIPVTAAISSIANTASGVKLTWNAVPGAAKYAVYRKAEGQSSYSRYTVTAATSYTDKNVTNGTFYYYRLWCLDSSGKTMGSMSATRGITANIPKTTYRALLVGETYEGNTANINPLPGIDLDVNNMSATLRGMSKMSWSITSRMDPTRAQIRSMISTAASQADSDDVTLFYYSGHGYVESGAYYAGALLTYDDYAITMSDLASWLSAIPGKVVVLLDSCGSGAAIRTSAGKEVVAFDPVAFNASVINAFAAADTAAKAGDLATSKFYVMTASDYDQVSYATNYGSYFTLGVAASAGYDGRAGSWSSTMLGDTNNNNILTLNESYIYTRSYVGPSDVQVYPANSSFAFLYK